MEPVRSLESPVQIFRVMQTDGTDRPLCGTGNCQLGARVGTDIRVDIHGQVHPRTGGISVTPNDPKLLPPHLRPERFGGIGRLPLFQLDETQLGPSLCYRPDPKRPDVHGFVEPGTMMILSFYQAALAATAQDWRLVP